MAIDYYSVLTRAVAGKEAAARDKIYRDAFSLITKSHLAREAASSQSATLQDAIRRIEDDIAREAERNEAAIQDVLSKGRSWKPLAIVASALVAVVAAAILVYGY